MSWTRSCRARSCRTRSCRTRSCRTSTGTPAVLCSSHCNQHQQKDERLHCTRSSVRWISCFCCEVSDARAGIRLVRSLILFIFWRQANMWHRYPPFQTSKSFNDVCSRVFSFGSDKYFCGAVCPKSGPTWI